MIADVISCRRSADDCILGPRWRVHGWAQEEMVTVYFPHPHPSNSRHHSTISHFIHCTEIVQTTQLYDSTTTPTPLWMIVIKLRTKASSVRPDWSTTEELFHWSSFLNKTIYKRYIKESFTSLYNLDAELLNMFLFYFCICY